jgi:hypothetical protein
MQVVQTAGEPPNWGRTILAIIGWTRNRSAAARKIVTANPDATSAPREAEAAVATRLGRLESVMLLKGTYLQVGSTQNPNGS